jgi:hypothetical protein
MSLPVLNPPAQREYDFLLKSDTVWAKFFASFWQCYEGAVPPLTRPNRAELFAMIELSSEFPKRYADLLLRQPEPGTIYEKRRSDFLDCIDRAWSAIGRRDPITQRKLQNMSQKSWDSWEATNRI